MKILKIYVAEDGEQFDTEEECLAWEKKITSLPPAISFYNDRMVEFTVNCAADADDAYNHCDYMRVRDIPSWQEDLAFLRDYWGFYIYVPKPGLYEYDDDDGWKLCKE